MKVRDLCLIIDELAPPARLAAAQRALIATLPPSVWAAFAVWGDAGCDR